MSELYNRIEALCAGRGINITDMCRNSGAPRGSLTDLKMGRTSSLNANTLSKIAAYFGVSVGHLLGEEPKLSLDEQIRSAESKKKEPADNDGLPESIRKLIDYAKTVPEDQAEMMLQTLQMMAAQADKMKEALKSDR